MDSLSKPLLDVYNDIEEQLLTNIASRIRRSNSLIDKIEVNGETQLINSWQLEQLGQLGDLSNEQIRTIAESSGETSREVQNILQRSGYSGVSEIEGKLSREAEKGRLTKPPTSIRNSRGLTNILHAYENQALDRLNLVNSTLIEQVDAKYTELINKTVGRTLSGSVTAQQALRQSVTEMAESGIPALIDRAGREWSPEAYVNMTIRSTRGNVVREMQERRMDEYGCDLVEISAHDGARPNCEPYQGRIYSRSGKHPDYPSLDETSIGEIDGLFGINCGHVMAPYFEGDEKTYNPMDTEENDRIYEESQQQRYLERQIRKSKREMSMLQTIGDTAGAELARTRVARGQENIRAFIASTGRTRRYDREQIFVSGGSGGTRVRTAPTAPNTPATPTPPPIPENLELEMRAHFNVDGAEKLGIIRHVSGNNIGVELSDGGMAFLTRGDIARMYVDTGWRGLNPERATRKSLPPKPFDRGRHRFPDEEVYSGLGDEIYEKLSVQERRVVDSYAGGPRAIDINRALNTGKYTPQIREEINQLSDVVSKYVIPTDTKVVRMVDTNFLDVVFDSMGMDDSYDSTGSTGSRQEFAERANALLENATFKNKSFMSTSYSPDKNYFKGRPVKMELLVEEGTPGLITKNHTESEVILDRDATLQFLGAEMQEGTLTLIARVLK